MLHCIETIGSGGVERRRLSIIKGLDSSIFDHKIICTKAINNLPKEFRELGVEIIEIGQFKYPLQPGKLKAALGIIKKYQPDIIHGAIFEGISMATIAGTIGKVPVRIAEETSFPKNRSKKATYLLKTLLKFADYVVAVSPNVYNYLNTQAGVPDGKLKLINNGISDVRRSSDYEIANLKSHLGISSTDIVIGSVGRVYDSIKRFSDILKAVKILDRKDIKVLIVGEGPDTSSLINLAKELGLEEQLIMVGFQPETALFYSLMDIFTIVSGAEGFGLVAVEAMLHSLPVIATRVGGLEFVVEDNSSGILIDPCSPQQLSAALSSLISNPSLANKFGLSGRERALKEFSAERYVEEVERLYIESLKSKKIAR
ncbi:hypothetical protein PKOR_00825 [Pontibacter korlensis]|uniref:Group 1 glycosyl transferase n=1 Tax=Pontibacter korlensis TaxID=400092 RepID=A0A0E3UYT7_9BACT|nr:hypothetical protein PKOR_00825 [Pontibacter korlensis]